MVCDITKNWYFVFCSILKFHSIQYTPLVSVRFPSGSKPVVVISYSSLTISTNSTDEGNKPLHDELI